MTKTTTVTTSQLNWLNRINLMYGAFGLALMVQFGANGAWKSFALGWMIAVANLELLKKLGTILLALYEHETKLPGMFFVLLVGKFAFWGTVLWLFTTAQWILGIPFVLGLLTILVSALGLGTKELVYGRT